MGKSEWVGIITAAAGLISGLLGKMGWDHLINRRKIELENDAAEVDLAETLRAMNVELLKQVQNQSRQLVEMEARFAAEIAEQKLKYAELEQRYEALRKKYEALTSSNGSRKKPDA